MNRWRHVGTRRPRLVILAVALVTAFAAFALAQRVAIDNSIPVWLPEDDPALERYGEFRALFGEDNVFFVLLDPVDPAAAADTAAGSALERDLRAIDGVARVAGPFGTGGALGLGAVPALGSADRRSAALLVQPAPELSPAARARVFAEAEARALASPLGDRAALAGPEAINQVMDRASQRSFGRLFPAVVVLVGLVVWLAVRDLRKVLAVAAVAGVGAVWTLAAVVLSGRTLNMVLSSVPALLVVLGTVYSLHLVGAFELGAPGDRRERWRRAIDETHRPCLWTALTTAAGLGALTLSSLPPVRDLGLFAALGVLIAFGLTFALLPALLATIGTSPRPRPAAVRGGSPAAFVARWRTFILLGAAAAVAVAFVGLGRLRIESHILSFFGEDHPLVQATAVIEDRILGLTPIEVWIAGPEDRVLGEETRAGWRALERTLASEPAVTGTFGPLSEVGAAELMAGALGALAERVRTAGDRTHVRSTIATRTTSIEESEALFGRVGEHLAETLPADLDVQLTGAVPILVRIQAALLRTQIESLALSLAFVTAFFLLAFRSARVALASLVPNLVPILLTLGAMGLLGVPLDVSTVTVASIALGLVVDDTIHLVDRWRRPGPAGEDARARIDRVFRQTGRPIVISSLAIAVGFAAFGLAAFRPTMTFGLLISATALSALACDLLLLPALALSVA